MRNLALLMILALAVPALGADAKTATWPQWRGPTRDGRVAATDFAWPDSLANLEKAWHVDLGEGYPSPIVSADRVFTVETKDGSEVVRAFDRATGKQAWEYSWKGAMSVPFFAMKNGSWVRSTPALDGDALYVGGMRDVLVRLDANTGKEVWRVDFVERYKAPLPAFGFVCSPLVAADGVYAQAGASFVKLDKATGKEIWRSLVDAGGMEGSAFSSPILATVAGRQQVLVQTRTTLAGVDPATGKVLWDTKVEAFRGMNILTPVVVGDGVFTSSYGGVTQVLAVKPSPGGEGFSVDRAWSLRVEGNMSTPVVIDGHAYLHRRDKRLSCVDLATGAATWTEAPKLSDYASLVTDGKKVLALDSRGDLLLIRHNPQKLELLDRKSVSEQQTWAHLAVCGNELFVREQRGLTVYRWK
ncbi:MAG TPA: PQQ-binding-like beta-propeller repeat protein [Humisphaera sp.]